MAEPEEQFSNQQAQRTEKKEPKIGQAGNVEFERLDIADLESVPVVAQALDNQWVPRELLGPAFQAGGIPPAIDEELRKLAAARMLKEPDTCTLQPTALVHEAWLRLAGADQRPWDRLGRTST